MRTLIGVNDPKAIRKQSAALAVEYVKDSYFGQAMMGNGEKTEMPIMVVKDLEQGAGDKVDYHISMSLMMQPVEGENPLSGYEESLVSQAAQCFIDDMRQGVDLGGRMTRKRTLYNLRSIARGRSSEWWGRIFDELFFVYLSGMRGENEGYILPRGYAGRAGNPLRAPDADHHMFGGSATSKATLTTADIVTLKLVDFVKTKSKLLGGGTQRIPRITPIKVNGAKHHIFLMDPWSEFNLRNATGEGKWLDLQKAMATAVGRQSPIFVGGNGMYNNVILHSHENVITATDGGAGADVAWARNLFLGRQALALCFGNSGNGQRFRWTEEVTDHESHVAIGTYACFGCRKNRYAPNLDDTNGKDFGVYAVDVASEEPANAS